MTIDHVRVHAQYFVLIAIEEIKVSHIKCQHLISCPDSSIEDGFERDEP